MFFFSFSFSFFCLLLSVRDDVIATFFSLSLIQQKTNNWKHILKSSSSYRENWHRNSLEIETEIEIETETELETLTVLYLFVNTFDHKVEYKICIIFGIYIRFIYSTLAIIKNAKRQSICVCTGVGFCVCCCLYCASDKMMLNFDISSEQQYPSLIWMKLLVLLLLPLLLLLLLLLLLMDSMSVCMYVLLIYYYLVICSW